MKKRDNFKGVWIDASIWMDDRLSVYEKVLFAEISSFSSRDTTYFKSNQSISDYLGCSLATTKRAIAHLIRIGLIEVVRYDGRVRHLKSRVIMTPPEGSESTHQSAQNDQPVSSQRAESNTTEELPLSIQRNSKVEVSLPFESEEFKSIWSEYKTYRQEQHGFKFKSPRTEQSALLSLLKIAPDERQAIETIKYSIGRGWKGLFPIPDTAKGKARVDVDVLENYIANGTV